MIVGTFDPAPLAEAQAFATDLPGVAPVPELLVSNRVVRRTRPTPPSKLLVMGPSRRISDLGKRSSAQSGHRKVAQGIAGDPSSRGATSI
jgi:hypothetical protein